ncbi:4-hydroxy-tetrahydrodipicolinate synthase [Sandarakinorhabdus limnophila]|uniref:4-hydroxy-tetrahydrodipicolinate synthase n=1 Tax=Sandarakinorhabdus limnophila TaxID=210512 RepID=UPI0026EA1587|nr:4-hydroxy-tetrahydrodipicolinate synthase [Sandarakinorhabdus limnophila]MCM0032071.1 4-hydroxy-tetrahydrodipicolinate synthase [Sandarakinorhabdus limnophila]
MNGRPFTGSMPALVTPFKHDAVDLDGFAAHVEWQIAQGSHGLVPVGTTGESPTLAHDEHYAVITACVEVAAKRVPVIAGCGSNDTRTALAHLAHAEKVGADAALIVVPYYNKPSQAGLIAHFTALHDATSLPIIIYNIPGRSVADMSVETMAELAKLPRIIGVKDATGNIARVAQQRLACGTDFIQLSGNDDMAVGFNAQGGVGAISVTANVAPKLCAQMQEATLKGDYAAALAINDRLQPLHAALFSDASPGPTKYALSRLGRMTTEVRLPIAEPSAASKAAVDAALVHAGLI